VINTAADLGDQTLVFTEVEMGMLCAIAYHQPVNRTGPMDIFGKEVSRDLPELDLAIGIVDEETRKAQV
jgi:segregation and condensation protein B